MRRLSALIIPAIILALGYWLGDWEAEEPPSPFADESDLASHETEAGYPPPIAPHADTSSIPSAYLPYQSYPPTVSHADTSIYPHQPTTSRESPSVDPYRPSTPISPPLIFPPPTSPHPTSPPPARIPAPAPTVGPTILIASFNIQVFGVTKLSKPYVMDILARVVRKFDVVAVQEIRSLDQTVLRRFVQLVNTGGRRYDYIIGERLGNTISKEQYAFIFDTSTIEVDRRSIYTVPDPNNYLHREPLVARFRTRVRSPETAFTFSLVNIHTDPDETDTELDSLDDVYVAVLRDGNREDDVILLGDLNVDEHHLGQLGQLPGIHHALSGVPTNTRRTRAYDNFVFLRQNTSEYTGTSGVLDLMTEFGLTESQALDVSDHMPIWAEFSVYETIPTGPIASRPTTMPR